MEQKKSGEKNNLDLILSCSFFRGLFLGPARAARKGL